MSASSEPHVAENISLDTSEQVQKSRKSKKKVSPSDTVIGNSDLISNHVQKRKNKRKASEVFQDHSEIVREDSLKDKATDFIPVKKKRRKDKNIEELQAESNSMTNNKDSLKTTSEQVQKSRKSKKKFAPSDTVIGNSDQKNSSHPQTAKKSKKNKKKKKKSKTMSDNSIVETNNVSIIQNDHDDSIDRLKSSTATPWLTKFDETSDDYYSEYLPCHTGRAYTTSIAIPASILETCLLDELRTYLLGQISRAACIYAVDEIVIYDDGCWKNNYDHSEDYVNSFIEMMKIILEFQECPQYLRKDFFPHHVYLKNAGLLNAMNAPHHLLSYQWCRYREGIVCEGTSGNSSFVHVGLKSEVLVNKKLKPGLRVTVEFPAVAKLMKKPYGVIVSPEEPRTEGGLYWGYTVRVAKNLSQVFESDRFKGNYDLIIGTSDKGVHIADVELPKYNHALIVFGGLSGIEAAMEGDKTISEADPRNLFKYYLNTCPAQQSRTIRTEEAVLISLGALSSKLLHKGIV